MAGPDLQVGVRQKRQAADHRGRQRTPRSHARVRVPGASEVAEKSYRLGLRELGFRVLEACNSRYRTFGFTVLGLGSQETPLQDQSFGDVTGVGFFR